MLTPPRALLDGNSLLTLYQVLVPVLATVATGPRTPQAAALAAALRPTAAPALVSPRPRPSFCPH